MPDFDSAFTFAFVRNPFDRLVSMWHYRRDTKQIPDNLLFANWIDGWPHENDKYHKPCTYWIDGTLDFIGRFERLEQDFARLLELIGRPDSVALSHAKQTIGREPYPAYYSDHTRDIVEREFASDLHYFGYSFHDSYHNHDLQDA